MINQPHLYTATMAKLFSDQGYLRKAAQIYRHLVARNPEDIELQAALSEIEHQITQRPAPTRKDTELLLREWMGLVKQKRKRDRQ